MENGLGTSCAVLPVASNCLHTLVAAALMTRLRTMKHPFLCVSVCVCERSSVKKKKKSCGADHKPGACAIHYYRRHMASRTLVPEDMNGRQSLPVSPQRILGLSLLTLLSLLLTPRTHAQHHNNLHPPFFFLRHEFVAFTAPRRTASCIRAKKGRKNNKCVCLCRTTSSP